MPYGAFVEFMPGKEGLLHISELDWKRIETMEESGLKEGDIIVAINGSRIGTAGSVSSLVSEYSAGETIKITIVRENKEIELSVKLDAYSK